MKGLKRFCGGMVLVILSGLFSLQVVGCSLVETGSSTNSITYGATVTQDTSVAVEGTIPTPQNANNAYLVPVAHLTYDGDSLSTESLDGIDIAVAGSMRDMVESKVGGNLRDLDPDDSVVGYVSRTPGAVGFVPWKEVTPEVKLLSLEYEGGEYPLAFGDAASPESEKMRRVVIGGDIVLDRGLPHAVYQLGYGLEFPMSGGYAAVTSRTPVPSEFSEYGVIHEYTAERQGNEGAVKEFLTGADLTLANFENPVLANATYHPEGTVFEGNLSLLPILNEAGIDGVTLANNHILDAGEAGLYETMSHLEDAGIAYTGAGADIATSRQPMIFDLGGTTVGVLNYQNVPSYEWSWATETTSGTAPLTPDILRRDIEALKDEVDTVIVMPHWGEEYTATPEAGQVDLAHVAVEAGADAVVGGHAHWAKGMEIHDETPVYYGVGNFLFDQIWSEETSTGIFVELTLYDGEVIQSRPVPYIVLDYGQPNFLVPEYGGDRALDRVYEASIGPEFDTTGR